MDFDPVRVTYEELVDQFFAGHNPTIPGRPRQYRSVIFVHDAEQERIARAAMERVQRESARPVQTAILPFEHFYPAEDYHQKYALQRHRLLWSEFRAMYPDMRDLVGSTGAARVNAYLYGEGTVEGLGADIDRLGLSPEGVAHLRSASPVGVCPVR